MTAPYPVSSQNSESEKTTFIIVQLIVFFGGTQISIYAFVINPIIGALFMNAMVIGSGGFLGYKYPQSKKKMTKWYFLMMLGLIIVNFVLFSVIISLLADSPVSPFEVASMAYPAFLGAAAFIGALYLTLLFGIGTLIGAKFSPNKREDYNPFKPQPAYYPGQQGPQGQQDNQYYFKK